MNLLLLSLLSLPLFTGAAQPAPLENQAVIIHIKLSNNGFGASGETASLYTLEDELVAAVGNSGDLDGHEIGGGFFTVYVYGANPDWLIAQMTSVLSRSSIQKGSYIELRSGPSDREVKRINLPLAELPSDQSKPAGE